MADWKEEESWRRFERTDKRPKAPPCETRALRLPVLLCISMADTSTSTLHTLTAFKLYIKGTHSLFLGCNLF